ncbi:MAG TPA: alginate lyase family protein [Longimicrobiaceae bacterium]|nr:alginate lyase family protein [Longimicrobiaceae bacterium]
MQARSFVSLVTVGLCAALAGCASAHRPAAPEAPRPAGLLPRSHLDSLAISNLGFAIEQYRAAAGANDPADGTPRSTRPDGSWRKVKVNDWTSGFFPGILWYLFEYTHDPQLRFQAERWTLPLAAIPEHHYDHDLGFQFNTSFVNAFRFTGEKRFEAPALNAARLLAGRFNPTVGAIKSWDWKDPKRPFPVIVDNMMNLELLYWGAHHGGDPVWASMANQHARTTIANHIRPDGGSFHVVVFDSTTGKALERITHQGYADSSTWGRGESWLVYGFTMAYRESGDAEFLHTARRVADYALTHLPADGVPCWDYQAPGCPETAKRDASAAAILASGLLELSTYVPGDSGRIYRDAAEHTLATLSSPAYLAKGTNQPTVLLHSVGNMPGKDEVDVGMNYADYYYVEALLRYLELRGVKAHDVFPTPVVQRSAEAPTAQGAAPELIVLRGDELASAKARLDRGDTALLPALRRLTSEADSALHAGPFSVMEKQRVPPSGDRHDYTSLGSYWWPDTSKPNGLPYVRHDGRRNPATVGPDYDARRRGQMEHAVHTLALAYYFTGNEAYALHAGDLLRTWFLAPATRMNPNLDYAQAIPGITQGRGIGIIDTHGFPVLLDDLALLRPSPHWSDTDEQGMKQWMSSYLEWLRTSKNGIDERDWPNNHGSWYDVQTAALALYVGRPELAREIVQRAETKRIAKQILPDGREPLELARTRSLHYSVFNLEALMQLAEIGRHVGVDLWHYEAPNGASIQKALDYLAPYVDLSRKWPGEELTPTEPDLLYGPLRLAQIVYGAPRYDAWIEQIPPREVRTSLTRILYPKPAGSRIHGSAGGTDS